MNTDSMRNLLLTTSIRFLPWVQPFKDDALDKIVTQILFTNSENNGMSLTDIEEAFQSSSGGYHISTDALEKSLQRVATSNTKDLHGVASWKEYKLSDTTYKAISKEKDHAEYHLQKITEEVFDIKSETDKKVYQEALLYAVALLFSSLGENAVDKRTGHVENLKNVSPRTAITDTCRRFSNVEISVLEKGLERFIQSDDPDYATIKWNIAQNSYVAKALGVDPSGNLLSKEMFQSSIIYLDTNVIIAALSKSHKYHRTFAALFRASQGLDIDLRICQISLDEMDRWLDYQRECLDQGVLDQIPTETASKTDWLFLRIYERKKNGKNDLIEIDELFEDFRKPKNSLRDNYYIGVDDNTWFDSVRNQSKVQKFAKEIKEEYERVRNKPKNKEAALHDATLISWVNKQREQTEQETNIWLVTSDVSLPNTSQGHDNYVVTLDGLLQWISPMTANDHQDEYNLIFAEMVRSRFLPQDKLFKLEDFRIFADLEMQCKNLPAEDVEGCIEYIKTQAPHLNLTNPEHREKLAMHVQKFFSDPSRAFNERLDEVNNELGQVKRENKIMKAKHKNDIEEMKNEQQKALEDLQLKFENEKRERQINIANQKMFGVFGIFIIFVAVSVMLSIIFGEGSNLWQQLASSWDIIALIMLIPLITSRLLISKQEAKLLNDWIIIIFPELWGQKDGKE